MTPFQLFVYPGILFVTALALLYSGILRKVAARMQNRIGPPVIQPFFDVIKLAGKEGIEQRDAGLGFTLWPSAALAAVLAAALMTPMVGAPLLTFSGSVIALLYFLVLSSASLYMAGFSSTNQLASTGAARGITSMVVYELAFIVAVLVPALHMGSLIVTNVPGLLVMKYPLAALALLIAALAKAELPPLHIPGAHQEIVAGYSVEFTGRRLALVEVTHMVKIVVMASLFSALYLGGAATLPVFLGKTLGVLFLLIVCRTIFARLRLDQAIPMYLAVGGLALIDLVRVLL